MHRRGQACTRCPEWQCSWLYAREERLWQRLARVVEFGKKPQRGSLGWYFDGAELIAAADRNGLSSLTLVDARWCTVGDPEIGKAACATGVGIVACAPVPRWERGPQGEPGLQTMPSLSQVALMRSWASCADSRISEHPSHGRSEAE